ncbi:MAG: glycosyltransferase family 39 protein [Bryobacteraceae bacterium]|nr:glycosyltransferase family 39 protein [Bryobacteraceae bacterium]MDW8377615.1 glycosyltransferase family 39 protein [Bryobacterales bacterium]
MGHSSLIVILTAAAVFLGCIVSPPGLMDDVDAVQAQIARNMLESGDWVTARLNGVPYLEKPPLIYWMMAASYLLFGVHDWAARIPLAVSVVLLCWVTLRFGQWAFDARTGFYAGLVLSTSVGLWLFTRIQIPDAILTLTITLALWSFLRSLEEGGWLWPSLLGVNLGLGLLLKGLIAILFPAGAALLYLGLTRQLLAAETWRRLKPLWGLTLALLIAAPWHVLATLANPPYLDFTLKSEPGQYRGFFWFYFLNEHLFRFLNLRYPRDYNTVPRLAFWFLHLVWLFPWSAFLQGVPQLSFKPEDRAGRTRLLALCWIGFILVFFTFSTTQEYYSMPSYPAFALLLASAMSAGGLWALRARLLLTLVTGLAALTAGALLVHVRDLPAAGDISQALTQNPEAYTLSLGHLGDLTVASFAYLRLPLAIAGIAFLVGSFGGWLFRSPHRAYLSYVLMMVLFFHAGRLALVAFDPYLGSRVLAEAYRKAEPGQLIVDDQYYAFSSVFFYANTTALLLNGRVNNLEYGSYAPGAPNVFIDDQTFARLWSGSERKYLLVEAPALGRIEKLVGREMLYEVKKSGGKFLLTNQPVAQKSAQVF